MSLKTYSIMKELFIKIGKLKIIIFLKKNYLWSLLIGFIPALCTFPPNIINPYRANGTIVKIYDKDIWLHVTGKGSTKTECKIIVLNDSSYYSTNDEATKTYLNSNNLIGKRTHIIYLNITNNNIYNNNSIRKLEIDGEIIYNDDDWLVFVFWFCLIWFVWGGIGEIVRIWKSILI